jgi:competence protein ComEA
MGTQPDWSNGPAKWIAVGVIGAGALAMTTWNLARSYYSAPAATVLSYSPAQPVTQFAPSPQAHAPVARVPIVHQDAAPHAQALPAAADSPPDAAATGHEPLAEAPAPPGATPASEPPPVPPSPPAAAYAHIINVNKATAAELELLPGIGPALAARIIDYRQARGPFRAIEDLTNVRGIGPKTLEKIRPRIRVD